MFVYIYVGLLLVHFSSDLCNEIFKATVWPTIEIYGDFYHDAWIEIVSMRGMDRVDQSALIEVAIQIDVSPNLVL
jgi:hypothetical protein